MRRRPGSSAANRDPAPPWSRDMLAHIVGDGGAGAGRGWSPAGWPSQSRSACCVRPSSCPSGTRSATSRDAGSRPTAARMGALPQPGPLVDRPRGLLDAGPIRAPRLLVAPGRRAREDQEPLADAAGRPTGGAIMPSCCWLGLGRRPTGLRLAAAALRWPCGNVRRSSRGGSSCYSTRDFRLEPTCPRRMARLGVRATAMSVPALSVLTFRPAAGRRRGRRSRAASGPGIRDDEG